jgi:hypothetical protein
MAFDLVQCLGGLIIGVIGGITVGVLIGMRLYWKTGHW